MDIPQAERIHARPIPRRRPSARPDKLPLRFRVALVLVGALLGWAVPIACASTLL